MKVQAVSIDLLAFGAQFANLDSGQQALFFRGLASELALWPSQYLAQMQFCHVADALSKEHKGVLENALGMLWFSEVPA